MLEFVDGIHRFRYLSPAKVAALADADFDFVANLVLRRWLIRKSDGSVRLLQDKIPGIGKTTLDWIHLCMRYAPQVLSPTEWGLRSPEITHGDSATLTPLVSRVRRGFFGEEGSERFIVTGKPLGYGWNRKRSFRVIGLSAQWWRL